MKVKLIAKNLLKHTPFYPTHMGSYIRNLYFWKYISKLPVKNFTKVLDAGCGSGEYALKMAQSFPWIDVIAMDIKRQNFQSNYPPNFLFKRGDLLELEERHNYDFIYSIDVLEHIPNNIKVLRNSYQALKHDGYLFLHMPYDIDKKSIFPDKFFAKFNVWAEKEHIGEQYTLDEIKSILQKIGFEIVEIEYTFGFPGELAWELDRITDGNIILKIIIMPLLKILGLISVNVKHRTGNILVIARK